MDEIDIASDRAELERETLVAQARAQAAPRLLPVGECYACGETVERPRLFCDSVCAGRFEARVRRR